MLIRRRRLKVEIEQLHVQFAPLRAPRPTPKSPHRLPLKCLRKPFSQPPILLCFKKTPYSLANLKETCHETYRCIRQQFRSLRRQS
jgi:hypothetical protein